MELVIIEIYRNKILEIVFYVTFKYLKLREYAVHQIIRSCPGFSKPHISETVGPTELKFDFWPFFNMAINICKRE